jgi:hypothetical protein
MSGDAREPKLSFEERLIQATDALWATRLWVVISQSLDVRGITDPEAIGQAIGLPAAAAVWLLNRQQWQDGDLLLLQAAASRLGLATADLNPW